MVILGFFAGVGLIGLAIFWFGYICLFLQWLIGGNS